MKSSASPSHWLQVPVSSNVNENKSAPRREGDCVGEAVGESESDGAFVGALVVFKAVVVLFVTLPCSCLVSGISVEFQVGASLNAMEGCMDGSKEAA